MDRYTNTHSYYDTHTFTYVNFNRDKFSNTHLYTNRYLYFFIHSNTNSNSHSKATNYHACANGYFNAYANINYGCATSGAQGRCVSNFT